jgi:hypothetical protein
MRYCVSLITKRRDQSAHTGLNLPWPNGARVEKTLSKQAVAETTNSLQQAKK